MQLSTGCFGALLKARRQTGARWRGVFIVSIAACRAIVIDVAATPVARSTLRFSLGALCSLPGETFAS